MAETLWPTRCALCETPGTVLCDRCARNLAFLDWWRACPRCGAAYGLVQCTSCNPVSLARFGGELPFAGCASAVMFDGHTGSLVRIYKDRGEQRLAGEFATMMARVVPPAWEFDAIAFVPASPAAYRRRGFDHGELLARRLAENLGVPVLPALARPQSLDQRTLGRKGRIENIRGCFSALIDLEGDMRLLLVDDVCTTGATLADASRALLDAGAAEVRCVTFARA